MPIDRTEYTSGLRVVTERMPGVRSVSLGVWVLAGSRDEAHTWYARVLDLWADADPELQPTVTRIRAALAAPGPPK